MEFGQQICSARPRCEVCPVRAGCAGPEPGGRGPGSAPAGRRRPRFEGSVRQRRGELLRQVLARGAVRVADADRHVAAGLAADGLAVLVDGVLRPPAGLTAGAELRPAGF